MKGYAQDRDGYHELFADVDLQVDSYLVMCFHIAPLEGEVGDDQLQNEQVTLELRYTRDRSIVLRSREGTNLDVDQ